MKKLLLLCLILLLSTSTVFSQSTTFRRSYDIGAFDNAGNMAETVDGGYVFGGINATGLTFYGGLTKTDAFGDVEWSNAYVSGFASAFLDVKPVSTGGYIATGNSTSGGGGAILIRVDALGNVIWANRYNTPNDFAGKPASETGNAVIEANDGGFVVAGSVSYFWDGVSPATIDTSSALAFKVDASGNIQWSSVWAINTTNPDEHFLNDVTETTDGFVFVGASSEGSGILDDDGDYPRNALVIKANKSTGATIFINRWGAGNTSSESINSVITLSTGNVLMSGGDGARGFLRRIAGTGSSFTHQWGRRINNGFLETYILESIAETSDGQYAYIGTRFIFLEISTILGKINPASNAIAFTRTYTSLGLSSILPQGGVNANDDFYLVMTDQQFTGFNYNMIKTDNQGLLNSTLEGCPNGNASPGTSDYNPAVGAVPHTFFTGLNRTGYTPVVSATPPNEVIHCLTTSCTPPPLADNVTATPNTICAGESTTINATGPGVGVSYNVYTAATGGTNLGGVPLVVSPGTTTTYYIETVNDADPTCVSTSRVAIEVVVNAPVTPTFNQVAPICIGDAFTLPTTSTNGYTGSWAPAINNTVTTEYTFTPDGGQCATAATMTVAVGDPVEPTFNQVAPICIGDAFTLPTTSTNGYTGSWAPAINNTVTTEYTFTPDGGQCATTATMTVVVGDPVTPTFNQVAPICVGDVFTLPATSTNGYTGSWSPAINNTVTTEYTFTPDGGQCATTATMTVAVGDPVEPTFNQVAPICIGDVFTLPTTSTNGYTGSWAPAINNTVTTEYTFTPDGGQCSTTATMTVAVGDPVEPTFNQIAPICIGDAFTLPTTSTNGYTGSWAPAINNTVTTEYTFTPDGGQCATTTTMTVVISDGPSLTISGNDISCFGANDGDAEVVATGDGPFNYSWSPSGGSSATASNLSDDSYTVTVTDANGCSNTENITINEPTELTLSTSSTQSSCTVDDGTATVVASGGTGSYTYSWSSGGNSDVEVNIGAGIYTITVTDANGCIAQENVTVGSVNGPTLTLISSENISCFGANDGSAEVEAIGGTPGYSYSWSPSGGTAASATGLGAGTYTATVTDDAGCSASVQVEITEPDALLISGNATDANCGLNDGTITVNASGGSGSYTYTWTPNVGNTAAVSGLTGGSYSVVVEDANGCSASTSFNVGVSGSIPIDVIPNFTTIDAGDNVDLEVIIGGGITGANITWSPSTGLSCTACPNPNASPSETTTYYVTVTAADGCFASDSVTVYVNIPCNDLFVPNIFSPNNDGNNDFLCIYGGCIESLEFAIYSRWGQKVFETTDPNECWDGTYKDKPMNSETFVYKMIVKLVGESEEILQSGNINLVR